MGKLNNFQYPDLTLNEAIALIRKIDEVGGTVSPTGLARLINIDPRGAGLHSRIEDLKTYGFIETNGQLKLSEVAQEILVGNMRKAWEAIWAIPLYAEMHRRLQGREPTDKVVLHNVLFNITKADMNDISRRASRLKNNYMEALAYLTGEKKTETPIMQSAQMSSTPRQSDINPMEVMNSNFTLVDKGTKLLMFIDKNPQQIALAQSFLEAMKKTLPEEGKPKPEKKSKIVELAEEISQPTSNR